jgi:hypothetical protein
MPMNCTLKDDLNGNCHITYFYHEKTFLPFHFIEFPIETLKSLLSHVFAFILNLSPISLIVFFL